MSNRMRELSDCVRQCGVRGQLESFNEEVAAALRCNAELEAALNAEPTKARQTFCKPKCRALFSKENGLQGEVAGVTRLLHGVSIVLHFKGPAEEKAVRLLKRQLVRVVVEP